MRAERLPVVALPGVPKNPPAGGGEAVPNKPVRGAIRAGEAPCGPVAVAPISKTEKSN